MVASFLRWQSQGAPGSYIHSSLRNLLVVVLFVPTLCDLIASVGAIIIGNFCVRIILHIPGEILKLKSVEDVENVSEEIEDSTGCRICLFFWGGGSLLPHRQENEYGNFVGCGLNLMFGLGSLSSSPAVWGVLCSYAMVGFTQTGFALCWLSRETETENHLHLH